MHWSPECTKFTYNGSQEAMGNSMNCISICSGAFVAAVPAPDVTDEVGIASSSFPAGVAHLSMTDILAERWI